MPGSTVATLVKQGAFDADLENQINTNFSNLNSTTAGIVASVSSSLGFAVFNAAAAVNLVAATGPAGTYRVTLYGVTTTTFVTNTEETITFGWTDDNGANTVVYTTTAKTAGTLLPPVSATVSNLDYLPK